MAIEPIVEQTLLYLIIVDYRNIEFSIIGVVSGDKATV
jgi:hypothetical protein